MPVECIPLAGERAAEVVGKPDCSAAVIGMGRTGVGTQRRGGPWLDISGTGQGQGPATDQAVRAAQALDILGRPSQLLSSQPVISLTRTSVS